MPARFASLAPKAVGGLTRPQWDAAIAVLLGIVAFLIASEVDLAEQWLSFAEQYEDTLELDEFPIAFLIGGLGFGWFAWRRWQDFQEAAGDLSLANIALSDQLVRNEEIITDLAAARQRALDLDRAKTRFLSHMSHELRTPLNAIMGFSDLMRQQVYGPLGHEQYAEYTASIYDSGSHLLELINDLLDLTRIESGDLTPHPEICTMADLIAEAFKMLWDQAAEAGIELTRAPSPVDDVPVNVDRRMIRQILINLIANSIRHTPRGGQIEVAAIEGPEGHIGFTVRDNGEGMAAGAVRRLERGFAEVENAFRREHHGAGIGLPLSRAIAEAHGGTLSISSAEGQGTLVEVHLPAACIAWAAERDEAQRRTA